MNFDIDIAIFLGFLAVTLVIGLFASRGVNTVRGFAIGEKNFSTATLVSTIVATWVGGSFFLTIMSESYNSGLIFIVVAVLGEFIGLLLIALIIVPRMSEFLRNLSVAEAMGDLYGNNVRFITTVSGVIGASGIIAIQLQIAGLLFEYALNIQPVYGIILSGIIITLYSSMGGIKSVTFTDVIQFLSFAIIIPTIAYFLFNNIHNNQIIIDTLSTNPLFNYKTIFTFENPQIYYYLYLFLWLIVPGLNPAIFQRIAMARDIKQARNSFIISSITCLLLAAIVCWIGVLMLSIHPNIKNDQILRIFIIDYPWAIGFKGFILAGIMAMIMSTVDSYINSSSVLLIHDLRESLHIKFIKNELFATRICSIFIGIIAILFAMRSGSFLDLFIWAGMFYIPVVSVPFIMAIFGFRSSSKSVLVGMAAGFTSAMIWELYFKKEMAGVGGIIPGILANLIVLFGFHYLFKQKGGWIGIKNPEPLIELRRERKERFDRLCNSITTFNLISILKNNTPKNDGLIAIFGLFIMISTFSSVTTIPKNIHTEYALLLNILYPATLFISSSLISYPLWLNKCKNTDLFIAIAFNAANFFVIICFSTLTVLISNFAEIQLMVFMINIIVLASLSRWRWSLFMIVLGVSITLFCYKNYLSFSIISHEFISIEFKIIYLLLLITSTAIIFLKPKQEYLEATEAKVGTLKTEVTNLDYEVTNLNGKVTDLNHTVSHYSQRLSDQSKEIDRLGETGQRILNNVNHELRLPVGNVMNFAEMLNEGLEKFSPKQLKMISDEVYKNSTRLGSMILNMLDLATLEVKNVNLQKRTVNFSELVENRVKICRSIYLDNKPINFKLTIDPEILISVDPDYIRQTIDNLVINAINFSEEGTIEVIVKNQPKSVEFMITDEGIGIPEKDIYDIFTPFKMGSNTESKAQGRGVGLALCQSAIKAHDGSIEAKSKFKGATFIVILPK